MNKDVTIVEYRLKLVRNLNRLTQKELAKEINVSRSVLNNWENGLREISLEKLLKISYKFKIPLDYFLGLTNNYNLNYNYQENLDCKLLGNNIRFIRKCSHLTQIEFGKKLNVTCGLISQYENAKIKVPISFLKDLCNVFGYSADWLVGNTKEIKKRTKKVITKDDDYEVFPTIMQ